MTSLKLKHMKPKYQLLCSIKNFTLNIQSRHCIEVPVQANYVEKVLSPTYDRPKIEIRSKPSYNQPKIETNLPTPVAVLHQESIIKIK